MAAGGAVRGFVLTPQRRNRAEIRRLVGGLSGLSIRGCKARR